MKLTTKLKLRPTPAQADRLHTTMEAGNAACNWISAVAWAERVFNKIALQKLVYYGAREAFGLGAQFTIRCIAKVVDSYQKDKATRRHFRAHGAVGYDSRILLAILRKSGRCQSPNRSERAVTRTVVLSYQPRHFNGCGN